MEWLVFNFVAKLLKNTGFNSVERNILFFLCNNITVKGGRVTNDNIRVTSELAILIKEV